MNFYSDFLSLLPQSPREVGKVISVFQGRVTVQLLTGAYVQAYGDAEPGKLVYVRGGTIEGEAPELPGIVIEI